MGAKVAVIFLGLCAAYTAGVATAGLQLFPYPFLEQGFRKLRPYDATATAHYRDQVEQFSLLKTEPDVVMLGDSLTSGGEWAELLGPSVVNRGVAGDTAAGLLARLDQSVPKSARTALVMIGTNDFGNGAVAKDVEQPYRQIVARLAPRKVIVTSTPYSRRWETNREVKALNKSLAALCATGACTFVDLNRRIAPNGRIGPESSRDGIHLTGAAYAEWVKEIKPLLKP